MASEWEVRRLGDLVEVYDGPHATPTKTTTGPIFLGISNLVGGRLNLSEAEHLSEEDFVRWTRRVTPQADDVVFSYETRLGEAALIQQGLRCCLGRRMGILRPRNNLIDSRFLLYAYLGAEFQETLRARTIHGSTVDRISLIDMPDFPIRVPSMDVQVAIANILGALDDKIELNRRMSETLENMARALFKSWFVEFDPVRAKAEGDPPSLPESIAALYPDALEPSAIGDIPTAWHVGRIEDVAEINGLTLSRTDPLAVIDYVEISEVMQGEIGNIIRYERGAEPSRARRRLRNGDTVLSTVRPDRGAYFLALNPPQTLIVSTGFAVLTPKNNAWAFLYSLATRREIGRHLGQLADGGAYPAIRPEAIGNIPVALPPTIGPIARFEQSARPLYEKCSKNREQSHTLAQIRDALLPKLVSGELRVPNAERILGGHPDG